MSRGPTGAIALATDLVTRPRPPARRAKQACPPPVQGLDGPARAEHAVANVAERRPLHPGDHKGPPPTHRETPIAGSPDPRDAVGGQGTEQRPALFNG